jgi:hypothetical protein
MVAPRESAELAKRLIADSCDKQDIAPGQLTIHADRGSSMTSKPVAFLMADLGVTKTHSRPYVSDDNPYSESQFRTMKCRPEFPDRFGSIQDARCFCQQFFAWYNEEHRHSGLELLTPAVALALNRGFRRARRISGIKTADDRVDIASRPRIVRRGRSPVPSVLSASIDTGLASKSRTIFNNNSVRDLRAIIRDSKPTAIGFKSRTLVDKTAEGCPRFKAYATSAPAEP